MHVVRIDGTNTRVVMFGILGYICYLGELRVDGMIILKFILEK